jgi:hypothetical protein
MERQVFSAESLGAATTSSTSWQLVVSLAFTPDAERAHLILATAQTSNQNTPGTGPICRLMHGASRRSADLFAMDGHPDGWWPIAQADIFATGASASEQIWTQEYTRHGTFATVAIREARLCALRLEAGDLSLGQERDRAQQRHLDLPGRPPDHHPRGRRIPPPRDRQLQRRHRRRRGRPHHRGCGA